MGCLGASRTRLRALLCHGGKTTLLFYGLTEEVAELLLGFDLQHSPM